MFSGKSSERYVGTGKKKDKSKTQLLEDARKKREDRAIEKKKNSAALVIQTAGRRYVAMRESTRVIGEKLISELSLLKSNVPFDTLFKLMRYCVYIHSKIRFLTLPEVEAIESTLDYVVKSCFQQDMTYNLLYLDNFTAQEEQQRWIVLMSSFLNIACEAISWTKKPDVENESEKEKDTRAHFKAITRGKASVLIHCFADFVGRPNDAAGDVMTRTTSRTVAAELCKGLRSLWYKESNPNESDADDNILKMKLSEIICYALHENDVKAEGEMSSFSFLQKELWGSVTLELVSFPEVWICSERASLLKRIFELDISSDSEDFLPKALSAWQRVFSSLSVIDDVSQYMRSRKGPFTVISQMTHKRPIAENKEIFSSTHLSLVCNFFDYAIEHDANILKYRTGSTNLWVNVLRKALQHPNVQLIAAIEEYHKGNKKADLLESSENIGDDSDEEDHGSIASERRDMNSSLIDIAITQTRACIRQRSAEDKLTEICDEPQDMKECKRPRLITTPAVRTGTGTETAGIDQAPSVSDTVALVEKICHPIALTALCEYCAACVDQLDSDDSQLGVDLTNLLQLLSILLVYSSSSSKLSNLPNGSSITSKILSVFAFNKHSQALVQGLWRRVDFYTLSNPMAYSRLFIPQMESNKFTQKATFSFLSKSVALPAESSTLPDTPSIPNTESSVLIVLLNVLSHQLLTIDDEEFVAGSKTLNISDICKLVGFLKYLMHDMYWLSPLLSLHENAFSEDGHYIGVSSESGNDILFLKTHLCNLQLLHLTTKCFNQLSVRNERIHFLPPIDWLWSSLGNSELKLLDVDENAFLDPKKTRARTVLLFCPKVIEFPQRAEYFQKLIRNDKSKSRSPMMGMMNFSDSSITVKVHRAALFESAFQELSHRPAAEWKKDFRILFVNEQGLEEGGIDGGGLFKEFVDVLLKDMFLPPASPWDSVGAKTSETERQKLFLSATNGLLAPNPSTMHDTNISRPRRRRTLEEYLFMGRMLGKAVYEEILVEPQFSGMFLNHLLGRTNFIDDLVTLDEEVYRSLLKLKRDYLQGERDVAELHLTFEVDTKKSKKCWELIPGGSDVSVTKENLVSYIYLFANYKLNIETYQQCVAFRKGFYDLIPKEWLGLFNTSELQLVIGGTNEDGIDVPALEQVCTYSGGYHPSQPFIKSFWIILKSFSPEDQANFLRFVTSCSRPPLLGYGQFEPKFNIMKIPLEVEAGGSRLPMAGSCFNLLKLPQYDTAEELQEKLLYAIRSKAGFELS